MSFDGDIGGHAELLTLAEAEYLAEKLLEHVELSRWNQAFRSNKATAE